MKTSNEEVLKIIQKKLFQHIQQKHASLYTQSVASLKAGGFYTGGVRIYSKITPAPQIEMNPFHSSTAGGILGMATQRKPPPPGSRFQVQLNYTHRTVWRVTCFPGSKLLCWALISLYTPECCLSSLLVECFIQIRVTLKGLIFRVNLHPKSLQYYGGGKW